MSDELKQLQAQLAETQKQNELLKKEKEALEKASELVIDIKGLDDVKDIEELKAAYIAQAKSSKKLEDKLTQIEKERDDTKRSVLLEKLKEAHYDIEDLKDLDLKTLESTVKILSKNNKSLAIQFPSKDDKESTTDTSQYMKMKNQKTGKWDFWINGRLVSEEELKELTKPPS